MPAFKKIIKYFLVALVVLAGVFILTPLYSLIRVQEVEKKDSIPQVVHTDTLIVEVMPSDLKKGISYEVKGNPASQHPVDLQPAYEQANGIFTFRGGPLRDRAAMGNLSQKPTEISLKWSFKTAMDTAKIMSTTGWGGGAGWTGQACLVEWTSEQKKDQKALDPRFRDQAGFKEVIQGSLCGKVYFLDLETGKPSREPIEAEGPVKGSVSVSPFGHPYLCVGQGIPKNGKNGFRIFDLNSHKLAHYQPGIDNFAYRGWGAFDSSPLFDKDNNQLWWPGENGLIYKIGLTNLPALKAQDFTKFRFKTQHSRRKGTESCLAAYRNLGYFTDNDGNVVCLDLQTLKPAWIFYNSDDTDASPVVDVENGHPYVYIGCEVDFQGDNGVAYFRKLDGLSGKLLWEKRFNCYSKTQHEHPLNGGIFGTSIAGKNKSKEVMVVSVARYGSLDGGALFWLNKSTGDIVHTFQLNEYAWSSPLDLYDKEGNLYVFTADAGGRVYLIDGTNATEIASLNMDVTFEASPVAWDDKVVLAGRGNKIYCFSIR